MLVQRVLSPASSLESWTVLGADDLPVAAIERYLAYLTDIERSPNTVKAYAHDLKDYFTFLDGCGRDWREVRLEDIGEFVAWLRLPPTGRDGRVAILPSVEHHVSASTVNRKLSALSAFYLHAARNGADLGELLITWGPAGRRDGWKPFLHHISKGQPAARRTIALKTSRKLPRILTADEVQTILDACGRLRDRLLFAVLYDTGCASARRSGSGTKTSPPLNGRSRCSPGITSTAHEPSRRTRAPSPYPQSWSGSMPTTCTKSTAISLRLRIRQPVGPPARPPAGLSGGL